MIEENIESEDKIEWSGPFKTKPKRKKTDFEKIDSKPELSSVFKKLSKYIQIYKDNNKTVKSLVLSESFFNALSEEEKKILNIKISVSKELGKIQFLF